MQVKQENVRGMIGMLLASIVLAIALPLKASAAESVTYLFPAPPSLPAFGPIRLANGKG
jgi:NitT/TauT family transport system substrate-binding protein